MKFRYQFLAAIAFAFAGFVAQAAPIVTFTTSGSADDWTLNFSVTDNLGNTNDIYFFGVLAQDGTISGSPSSAWSATTWPTWNNSGYGGSSTVYNNNWIDFSTNGILPGDTLNGFTILDTSAAAPPACNGSRTQLGVPIREGTASILQPTLDLKASRLPVRRLSRSPQHSHCSPSG
ncbi:MAG: hypothetical protein ACREV7_22765 [Steroidobacteraceae bacterium]